jgi:hypothetical protein
MNIFKAVLYGMFNHKKTPSVNKIIASKKLRSFMFSRYLFVVYAIIAVICVIQILTPYNWFTWVAWGVYLIYVISISLIITNDSVIGRSWDFERCTIEQLADINEISDLLDEYQQIDLFRMMDRKIGVL